MRRCLVCASDLLALRSFCGLSVTGEKRSSVSFVLEMGNVMEREGS